jgi:hypothetical protein
MQTLGGEVFAAACAAAGPHAYGTAAAHLQAHCRQRRLHALGHLAGGQAQAAEPKRDVAAGGWHHNLMVRVLKHEPAWRRHAQAPAVWAQHAAAHAQERGLPGGRTTRAETQG